MMFGDFPLRQKPGSVNIDQAMEDLTSSTAPSSK
jgi:hypothetical protein